MIEIALGAILVAAFVMGVMYAVRPERFNSALAEAATGGPINPELVCPHCHTRGRVHTSQVKVKAGISGPKATAAVLTSGASLIATGLSKKEHAVRATCDNCNMQWTI